MEEKIKIHLPQEYEAITEEDIRKAKKWTLKRNENALKLSSLIEELLQDAIKQLTQISYKYNCPPEQFQFSQDKKLREDVAQVMSELEDNILELVEEYSLNETQDKKKRSSILQWLIALHSKGTKDLRGTLHERLRQFLYDTEAQIAAMKLARYNQTKAISRAISTMHTVYAAPEVQAAFKKLSTAIYIIKHGVHEGNIGLSSSGSNNVESFGYQSATLGWEKSRYEREKEEGKAGYYVRRGSTFPCAICDDVCAVFHPIEEGMVLPVHSHCCCFAVFVGIKEKLLSSTSDKKDEGKNRAEFEKYDTGQWEHSYFSEKGNGFVVTENERIEEASRSPNEKAKYDKEYRMCRVAADNGLKVEYLHGNEREKGNTYDVRLNGIPADLKSTNSVGDLVKHIRKAYKEQGAEAVLIEFQSHKPEFYDKLNEAKRKYNVKLFFYFTDEKNIREM